MRRPGRPLVVVLSIGALWAGSAISSFAQQPLTLAESVSTALQGNPQLEAARHARNAALVDAQRARPALRPNVQVTASQIVRGPKLDFPKRFEEVTVLPRSRTRLEIAADQPIYQFGAGRAPRERAEAMAEAAEADLEKAELDVAFEASQAYINASLAAAMERLAVEAVSMAQEQLRVTRLLVEEGELAVVDILRAQESLAQAEAGVVRARNATRLAKANLNRVMGRPVGSEVTLQPLGTPPAEPPTTEELLPEALRNRPEVDALKARIAQAEAGSQLARSALKPLVSAELNYQLQNPSAFVPTSQWLAGLEVTMPLFGGGGARFDIRKAHESAEQARAGLRALEQGIALEIEQARIAYLDAAERVRVSDRGIEAAREAYRITQLIFEADRATPLELETSRLALTRAESQREQAIFDMWLAYSKLERALGREPQVPAGAPDPVEPPAAPAPSGSPS